ncbi:hypothetical protein LPB86_16245 [Pedobacter sp. MC2016-14]|uniref:hypothetical protein n=1 Tax=Pedobacter sp. MC2016-14 TaxID=2897327 RepID=UPI001E50A66B|nr:hypothetical protein [Pedobacter sp. MC2016-14]MCD0489795.1 hypothetical protein [Pedobacter sp. MC2016-14]
MSKNDLILRYDGICVYATSIIKASVAAKFVLLFLNLFVLGIITIFAIGQIPIAMLAFIVVEFFVIKYTLWNLFGEERIIINTKSLSYQQHYGLFTTTFQTLAINKKISVLVYEKITEKNQNYVKFAVESYNENNLSEVIYHSVLHLNESNFEKLIQHIDRLFIDGVMDTYEMPAIHLN